MKQKNKKKNIEKLKLGTRRENNKLTKQTIHYNVSKCAGQTQQIHVELGCNQRVFFYFNIFSSFFFFPGLCHNSWTQFGGSFIKGSGLWKNWQAVRVDLNSPALFHHVGELAFLTEMFSSGSNGRLWKAGAHQPENNT